MVVTIGTHIGSHKITALLGKGGMGEVYRPRDTKLKREVAIKILPDTFSHDPDRVSRFEREAEVLAALNHPNIAAIYDRQEASGLRYLLLELVEGETHADKLMRGPLLIDEALTIAESICEASNRAQGTCHFNRYCSSNHRWPSDCFSAASLSTRRLHCTAPRWSRLCPQSRPR
jgi:serine/threonine protein kinase